MAAINLSKGSAETREVLPTDVYVMKITDAKVEEDQFAEPNRDGSKPEKIVITWKVSRVSDDQDEGYLDTPVWQRFNPFYGPTKAGPSKFKAFIDGLIEQGLLPDFTPDAFDTDDLIDIEQRVSIECRPKKMGANIGQPGNYVTSVMPLKRKPAAKVQGAQPRGAVPVKNMPQPLGELQPVAAGVDDEGGPGF